MSKIVWQYSEEWMRQEGIFDQPSGMQKPPSKSTTSSVPTLNLDAPNVGDDDDLRLSDPSGFVPALNKNEAVSRISRRSKGGPETLGPGSTEHKSVLTNLATALQLPNAVLLLSKPELGERIAQRLGQPWDAGCWSAGSTVTLTGLNRLLEGAERQLSAVSTESSSPTEEAARVLQILHEAVPPVFEGKACIGEMKNAGSREWAQTEWPGWYFEYCGIPACIRILGGGPVASPGRPIFDYGCSFTWDFKAHSAGSNTAILNDRTATDWAVGEGGLGFFLLHGESEYDPAFAHWFSALKLDAGKVRRTEPSPNPRRIKSRFTPLSIDAFYFSDPDEWASAEASGAIAPYRQGKQSSSGKPRQPKYEMNIPAARSKWLVAEVDFK